MVPIEWTIDEVREFPWNQSTLKKRYKNTIPDKVHSAVVHGMKFYVQNEMLNEFIASRHVMVVDHNSIGALEGKTFWSLLQMYRDLGVGLVTFR